MIRGCGATTVNNPLTPSVLPGTDGLCPQAHAAWKGLMMMAFAFRGDGGGTVGYSVVFGWRALRSPRIVLF